jgi:hypothetical protein
MPVEVNKDVRASHPRVTLRKNKARYFREVLKGYGTRSHLLIFESGLLGLLQ